MAHYRLTFTLRQNWNYSIEEMEAMYPFERDAFLVLLEDWLKEQREKLEKQRGQAA